jgi:aldose sugar dehydrogenase
MKSARMIGCAAVLAIAVLAACTPAKAPPPAQPPPQDPFFGLPPVPPDQGPPPNSPALATDTNFVTGLTNPWDMAFLGDGTMFFTQRPGPVKVRLPVGTINDIVTPGDVVLEGAGGMMGVAVDPSFGSNRFLYTCYLTSGDVRVVRWQVNLTLNGVVGSGTPILTGIPHGSDHFGCRIRFGPDGNLYIGAGDGAIATAPQDLNSLAGKILRVTANGNPANGNPFIGQAGDDRIYTFGHRNPQGLAFRPGSGQPYSVEHGSAIDDEVNQLVPGGNGGWDPIDEFGNYDGYDTFPPMTDLQKFPDAMIPAWRSGDPTLAPSGATFLTGSQWKSWQNEVFVAFLKDSKARVMFLNGNGDVSFTVPVLANGVRLRSAVQGPDGNLYISTDVDGGGGAIWKVVPS